MTELTVQDLAYIVQTVQVCSSRNVFKLQEYTHVKNVFDYFAALHQTAQPVDTSDHVQPVEDMCKLIEMISERGGFHLLEFELVHRLYQRLKLPTAAESVASPSPSDSP